MSDYAADFDTTSYAYWADDATIKKIIALPSMSTNIVGTKPSSNGLYEMSGEMKDWPTLVVSFGD
jgi:hypothetical protein